MQEKTDDTPIQMLSGVIQLQSSSVGESSKKANPVIHKKLLDELECPICNEYMIQSIFVCPNGHSLCGNCKSKIVVCPSCNVLFGSTRNFALEKISGVLNYPCKNEHHGCKFVGNSTTISDHNKNCSLKLRACPLKESKCCRWKGLIKNLQTHVKEKHSSACINVKEVVQEYLKNSVCWKRPPTLNGSFSWAFQHIGLKPNKKSPFKFEIRFEDQSDTGRKFTINALCKSEVDDKDSFESPLSIPCKLLEPFIRSNTLTFKYFIQRK